MPTGPSSDAANPSRHSWLAREGGRGGGWGHPMMWATAGLVLLGGSGAVVLLHEPGGRPQAQTTYCGLVTCAVLRSTAATSSVPAGAVHSASPASPTPAPSPRLASPRAPAPPATTIPTPSPGAATVSTPTTAPWPRPTPALASGSVPSRWPWPVWWPPSGRWGPGRGQGHGYPAHRFTGFGRWPGSGR
jgi:hypothetical protein